MDRRYLQYLAQNCGGGPAGVETLAAALGDQRDVLEDVIEPYLIQQGFLQRTQRGRMLTLQGWRYLGLEAPRSVAEQLELIEAEPDVLDAQGAGNG
jgi:Holliday junction DNA helicase RuvB